MDDRDYWHFHNNGCYGGAQQQQQQQQQPPPPPLPKQSPMPGGSAGCYHGPCDDEFFKPSYDNSRSMPPSVSPPRRGAGMRYDPFQANFMSFRPRPEPMSMWPQMMADNSAANMMGYLACGDSGPGYSGFDTGGEYGGYGMQQQQMMQQPMMQQPMMQQPMMQRPMMQRQQMMVASPRSCSGSFGGGFSGGYGGGCGCQAGWLDQPVPVTSPGHRGGRMPASAAVPSQHQMLPDFF